MDYGAYAKLDEFNKKGFLHISEISSARIRNVRDFVRENQKLVLKVVHVNLEKGHIDLSLRRVTKRERIEKIKSWKKERKGETLQKAVSDKLAIPMVDFQQKAGALLEEKYGLYEAFEKVVIDGPEFLTKIGIPEDIAKVIEQVAEERIKIKMVKVRGVVTVRCMKPNGVTCIKNAFTDAKKAQRAKNVKIELYVIAAPNYSLEVFADNWKRAEDLFDKVSNQVVENIAQSGGEGSFKRTK
jgi:translation initiation factor 2 subunit 1